MMELLSFCGVILITLPAVHSYGSGAPSGACESLMPGHNTDAQSSSTPYAIEIEESASTYTTNQRFKVKISGGNYKGFLLQARRKDSNDKTPVGKFISDEFPSNTRPSTCTSADDSATHANTNDKNADHVYTWEAPDSGVGDIYFIATVAQEKNIFWMNHVSSTLMFDDSSDETTPQQEQTATPPPQQEQTTSGAVRVVCPGFILSVMTTLATLMYLNVSA